MQTAIIRYSFCYPVQKGHVIQLSNESFQPDKHTVEALSQHPRQVLVVDGVEELRLV